MTAVREETHRNCSARYCLRSEVYFWKSWDFWNIEKLWHLNKSCFTAMRTKKESAKVVRNGYLNSNIAHSKRTKSGLDMGFI